MVSAFSICFLAIGLTVVSSQFVSGDPEDVPTSERRTFKHGKPVKILPLIKKHKKFGFVPHVFNKPSYSEVPIIHESPRPLYKYHRYQGIEVKPVPDFVSTPEPIIETHSVEPPTFHDYAPAFSSDHSYSHDSSAFAFPKPIHPSLAFIPKPTFTFVPAPQPIFSSIPISIPAPAQIARPIQPPAHVFVSIPSVPASPPPPIFQSIPVKIQTPILQPLPVPSPAPVFSTVTQAPPPAAPVFAPIASLPPPSISIPAPSPSPIPSFSALPSPAPSFSISTPEPEYPYPPSGTPIPSYAKDISLGDISLKDMSVPTIETPKFEEVSPAIHDESKILDQNFLQKFKGWKADKANAALSYFKKPAPISFPQPTKLPLELLPSQAPVHPSLQFSPPPHSLPLAPAPLFFRPQFFPHAKYESFPPNHIESPPALYNSYGAPIPHDSYASDHTSHDRLSSASEEQPVVLPTPNEQKQDQILLQQQSSQIRKELAPKFQPQEQPVYVPEENKVKEENKATDEIHQDVDNYQSQKELNADEVDVNLRNHKI